MNKNLVSDAQEREAALSDLPVRRIVAAPSWVMPGTMAENCAFLSGRVDEAGLLFFEAKACLDYSEADLPASLSSLPLSYHVHLPLDLPYEHPETSASLCFDLLKKTAFLKDGQENVSAKPAAHCRAVLHPPEGVLHKSLSMEKVFGRFLDFFVQLGGDPRLLCVENIRDNNLTDLEPLIRAFDCGVCLDSGHMLAYGQEFLASSSTLLERTRIVHLNAPGKGKTASRHLSLTTLDSKGRQLCERLVRDTPLQSVVMLELFRWEEIEASMPLLCSWLLP